MSKDEDSRRTVSTGRRSFLRQFGAATLGLATVRAVSAGTDARRELSFVHTHTGEQLTATYFESGGYVGPVLQQVNQLLRDFRTGEVHPIAPQLLDLLAVLRARLRSSVSSVLAMVMSAKVITTPSIRSSSVR